MYIPGIQCDQEQEKLSSHASMLPWSHLGSIVSRGTTGCSQGLASSSDFGTWVSTARRHCPHNGFQAWLASKNGKKLNYFWDCWREGQGSFRAMEKGEDTNREGCGTSGVALHPQTWGMEMLHTEKEMSHWHWHSGLQ